MHCFSSKKDLLSTFNLLKNLFLYSFLLTSSKVVLLHVIENPLSSNNRMSIPGRSCTTYILVAIWTDGVSQLHVGTYVATRSANIRFLTTRI